MNNKTSFNLLNASTSFFWIILHSLINLYSSYLLPSSIFNYIIQTSIFLLAMGLSPIIIQKTNFFIKNIIYIYAIGLFAIHPGIYFIYHISRNFDYQYIFAYTILLNFLLGFLSGFELPFFYKKKINSIKDIMISDYIGSFLGIIFFYFLMLPFLDLVQSIFYIHLIFSILLMYISYKFKNNYFIIFIIIKFYFSYILSF